MLFVLFYHLSKDGVLKNDYRIIDILLQYANFTPIFQLIIIIADKIRKVGFVFYYQER